MTDLTFNFHSFSSPTVTVTPNSESAKQFLGTLAGTGFPVNSLTIRKSHAGRINEKAEDSGLTTDHIFA